MRRLPLFLLMILPLAALNLCMFGEALQGALPDRKPAAAMDGDKIPRMVVLVFDGVDFRLATRYIEEGKLPELAALSREGSFHPLLSEIPPESPVALASMLTGVNPGRHRIFGAPSFLVGDELFWGDDRLEDAIAWASIDEAAHR